MRNRMAFLLLCFLLLLPLGADGRQNQPSSTTTITVLQLNDVYQIAPVDGGRRGGMARVATLEKSIRAESPHTLFLLAGDFISPSVASRLFKGEQMVATLNATGLDIATLGNHEFDFGPDVLLERMKQSRFAYTIANVFDKTNKPFGGAHSYIIREMGGVRVAVFGLLLAETSSMSKPGTDVRFEDPIAVGRRLSRRLRQQGADLIIALTHLPMREDKRLAAEADIDLIVGGHEHELLESLAGRTLILKMGSDARNLGRMDLHMTRDRRSRRYRLESIDWKAIPVDDKLKEDPAVAAVVAPYEKQLNESLSEKIGETTVQLEARAAVVRRGESNLGNYLADSYRQALSSDIALVNSGGIRSDATYGPGDITKKDVLTILPFENTLVKVKITGEHLKRLLENGVSEAGNEDGRFPQVSGFSFTYDASQPVGSRVTDVEVGGNPMEPDKAYTMAVSAYLLGGGDGYDFRGAGVLVKPEEGPVEPDVVMEAIKKAGTISPKVEGRIKSARATNQTSIILLPPYRRIPHQGQAFSLYGRKSFFGRMRFIL
ncbi:MAG: 5'-nucleotidase C-terminal domain-containing protein [Blastocatellia bacterium]|nr:5'-nucleotidase C-terminal domain-containing protein [Blastocatellia bacterium]